MPLDLTYQLIDWETGYVSNSLAEGILAILAPRGDEYSSISLWALTRTRSNGNDSDTYSGKRAQNIAEGIGADILLDGLQAADAAGYNPILSVHDEAITEPPDEERFTDGSSLAAYGRIISMGRWHPACCKRLHKCALPKIKLKISYVKALNSVAAYA